MLNIMSKANGLCYSPRISLNTMWYVKADNSYHIINNFYDSGEYIALRTINGQGLLKIHNSEFVTLEKDTLYVFKKVSAIEYYCHCDMWEFSWLEFFCSDKYLPAPYNIYNIPVDNDEKEDLDKCFSLLQSNRDTSNILSSAIFTVVLVRWLEQMSKNSNKIKYNIDYVISYIIKNPYDEISIASLAKLIGMSERSFRTFFKIQTGMTPKEYIIKNKLDACFELLQTTNMHIKDIASLLGFSNQYYFSRIFCKYFGYPPMIIRKYISNR